MSAMPVEPRVAWITDPPPPCGLTYFSRWVLFLRTGFRPESGDPADWSEEALAKLPTEIPRIGAVVGYWVRYGRGCAIRFNLDGEPLEVSDGIPAPWLSGRQNGTRTPRKPEHNG